MTPARSLYCKGGIVPPELSRLNGYNPNALTGWRGLAPTNIKRYLIVSIVGLMRLLIPTKYISAFNQGRSSA